MPELDLQRHTSILAPVGERSAITLGPQQGLAPGPPKFLAVHWLVKRLFASKLLANSIGVAPQSLNDIASHTIDFAYIAELSWAVVDDFPGFETTVIEQVGQSLFASVVKHLL